MEFIFEIYGRWVRARFRPVSPAVYGLQGGIETNNVVRLKTVALTTRQEAGMEVSYLKML